MPHLRFTRDKRGYENTYVVHSIRGRGKANPRILYWFRTPPNVRVGRGALDEGAIRSIEEQNPEISFDWTKILEAQPTPAASPDRRRRSREGTGREPQARRRGGRPDTVRRPDAGRAQEATGPVAPAVPVPATFEPAARAGMFTDAPIVATPGAPTAAPAAEEMVETADQAPASVPVTVYHGGADVLVASAVAETPRVPAVEAHLGSEQLGRLRARHAEILARITERAGSDPVQLEALRRAAEALNPDSWVTDAEITAGLQHFDARLGEIRRVLGVKRRRRSRRGGRRRRGRGTGVGTGPAAGVTATSGAAPANGPGLSEADEPEDDDPDDPADPMD